MSEPAPCRHCGHPAAAHSAGPDAGCWPTPGRALRCLCLGYEPATVTPVDLDDWVVELQRRAADEFAAATGYRAWARTWKRLARRLREERDYAIAHWREVGMEAIAAENAALDRLALAEHVIEAARRHARHSMHEAARCGMCLALARYDAARSGGEGTDG
jgi:hypothetical protein